MHHLCAFSLQIQSPLQLLRSHNYTITNKLFFSSPTPIIGQGNINKWRVLAMDREPKFEVDQEKARQALNELDLQLESLSKKQINPPKIKASSLGNLKAEMREEPPEMSGPVFGYIAFALFAFSIFYNTLFATVIKPYVDGPDDAVVANVSTSGASVERQP